MAEIPTIVKRKLQAQVIGPIYAEMVEQVGEEKASAILDSAIRKAAIAEGIACSEPLAHPLQGVAGLYSVAEQTTRGGHCQATFDGS